MRRQEVNIRYVVTSPKGTAQHLYQDRRHKIHKTANELNTLALSVQINMKTDPSRDLWSVDPRGR
jgi:hypothetical protein